MTINALMAALVAELAADGIPEVLTERFTFACLWSDLARLAREPLPRDVAAVLDRPLDFVPVAVPSLVRTSETMSVYAD